MRRSEMRQSHLASTRYRFARTAGGFAMSAKTRIVPMAVLLLIGALGATTSEAGVVVTFSSSDNFGVPAVDLDAKVTFTEVNNVGPGGTLTIKVENLSISPPYALAD